MSIQIRILELEAFVTADKLLPFSETPLLVARRLHKCALSYWLIEQRWSQILEQNDSPRVKRLITLIEGGDIREYAFCAAIGRFFFFVPSLDCWIPPLKEFKLTPEQIEYALELGSADYKINSHFQHKCVTHVLMNMNAL